ncbi:transcription factor tau subunit sfc1 [Magnaporthiopsis poae ATCC 64411]|uniref:Transcription factor tau subunit sfc1 n=1 Tax=Magnaporthiopsis poae (strain ATCC 64411 / 73-15) TaxID=644358 RepID=A0A0C4EFR7_MAGP6|nr:transcription factor tau subunit sfc1 [Magnaporthiopsis poae ATCC 64411]
MGPREHDVLRELELSARSASQDAPFYQIPSRAVSAVEHPMVVLDHDKAMKTFGSSFNFHTVLDHESPQLSVPLYLRYDNPVVRPIISHNAASHNVLLRIDVPRRTGRKRKRGSDGPWQEPDEASVDALRESQKLQVHSQKRLDSPGSLRRKLRDNVGRYEVEAVGLIRNTHRYRGLADFQYSTANSPFMSQVVDKILPGDVAKLRQFAFRPEIAQPPNVEIIPPPVFSHMSLPFAYGYSQNPYVRTVDGADKTINVQARVRSAGYFISHNHYPVPDAPSRPPDATDPQMAAVVAELRLAMAERPLWTRRSLTNRIMSATPFSDNLIKTAIPYVAYQFKAGPWRDAMIPYGLDPRSDPNAGTVIAGTGNIRHAHVNVPLPDLGLTDAELAVIRGREQSRFHSSLKKRVRRSHGTQYRIPVLTNSGQEQHQQKLQRQQQKQQQGQGAGVDGGGGVGGAAEQSQSLTVTSSEITTAKLPPAVVRFEDTPLRSVEDVINQDDDDEEDDEDENEMEDEEEGEGEGDDLDGDEEDEEDEDDGVDEEDLAEETYYEGVRGEKEKEASVGPKTASAQMQNASQLAGPISGRDDGDDDDEGSGEEYDDEENEMYDDEDGYSNDDEAVFGGEFASGYDEEGGFSSAEEY